MHKNVLASKALPQILLRNLQHYTKLNLRKEKWEKTRMEK